MAFVSEFLLSFPLNLSAKPCFSRAKNASRREKSAFSVQTVQALCRVVCTLLSVDLKEFNHIVRTVHTKLKSYTCARAHITRAHAHARIDLFLPCTPCTKRKLFKKNGNKSMFFFVQTPLKKCLHTHAHPCTPF